jgi:polyphenol oxidase
VSNAPHTIPPKKEAVLGSAVLGVMSQALSAVPGVSHRFFGRVGGTSPHPWHSLNTSHDVGDLQARVVENLARVRFQVGVTPRSLFTARQVHGDHTLVITGDEDMDDVMGQSADALVCAAPQRAVAVRTADCAPILCAVDDGSAVAAIHAGWRGAVGQVIDVAVASLCAHAKVSPARIIAAIGPCIGMAAFEVGPEVVAAVRAHTPDTGLTRAGVGDRHHVDLAGLCKWRLQRLGVERVDVVGGCTVEQPMAYFSHRRDNGKTGRQLSVIARTHAPIIDPIMFG